MAQIEGRCHRNGKAATIWYAFAEATIEENIAATVIARMLAMDGMAGDDTALLAAIAAVIEAAAAAGPSSPSPKTFRAEFHP
jgi:hypothetical protein